MKPPDLPTFEWNESKNKKNIAERGLDFADAQYIFDNPVLRRVDSRQDYGEERIITLGTLHGLIVSLVYTIRKTNSYRVISLRRARRNERKAYSSWLQRHEKQD